MIKPSKSSESQCSDEEFVEEVHFAWYDSNSKEVISSPQIVSVSSSSSYLVSMKKYNTMAYRISVNTPTFYGDWDPKKNWLVCEYLWKSNLIDDKN